MTKEGYEKLKAEIDDLKSRGRQEVAKAIAEAREKGDLSENAEYDAAKDAQGMLEAKINELDKMMASARILDESELDLSKVTILSTVKLMNKKSNKEIVYKLVSKAESNLKEKKISVDSPIGQGILGKAVGDIASISTPGGIMEFEVLDIYLA